MPKIKVKPDDQVMNWRWRIVRAGMNQKYFCEEYDIWQPLLSAWVTGAKVPKESSRKKMEKILRSLGV